MNQLTASKSVQPKSKAEKKEEKKREKELKKILQQQNQKRDHLSREEKFAEVSSRRGWDSWQSWCEDVKIDELRNDLKVVSKSVLRLMDNTEKTIETIQTHREHADDQFLRNVQAHSGLIDYIMKLFNIFKDSAHEMYEQTRERLVSDFYNEAFNRDSVHHSRKTFYENLAHATVSLMKCDLNQMGETFVERNFEVEADKFIKQEELETRAKIRETIACSEVRNLVHVFNNNWWPKSRYNQYKDTLKKSVEIEKLIEELQEKIQESLRTIAKLDHDFRTLTRECQIKIAERRSEYRFMIRVMQQLEEKVKQESLRDQNKIIYLVSVCETTKNKLEETHDRGRKIQSAMKVCKKFEKLNDELESSESSEAFPNDLFLRKLSKVEADCVMLRTLRADLQAKNEKLEKEIKSKRHEFSVQRNMAMLRLDSSPSVGQICQISHQIPQISSSISLHKR